MLAKCEACGKPFRVYPSQIKRGEGRFCSRACSNPSRGSPGERNGNWKGGRYRLGSGYIGINVGGGQYRLEHALVMEKHLGRMLRRGENVHHINGCRDDNRLENLELLSVADHARRHRPGRVLSKWTECQCLECGKVFLRHACEVARHPRTFCSRKCYTQGAHLTPGRSRTGP